MNLHYQKFKNIVIIGGGHGIGLGITKFFLNHGIIKDQCIFVTYHRKNKADELFNLKEKFPDKLMAFQLDPVEEDQVVDFSKFVRKSLDHQKIDCIINSVGFLHDEEIKPEKSLRDISVENLLKYFKINSLVTPLLAKHFQKLIAKENLTCFITISAKVGSISDNKMGGWYGYRSSKAALNMFIKNLAIEFSHRNINCIVLAYHPGTTETELSSPYISKTRYKLHSTSETAENLMKVINNCKLNDSGKFLTWDQKELLW